MADGAPLQLPMSFDWRTEGKVTSVKNQGACGSCYAFAAIANVESEILIDGAATLPDPDYSENNTKECNWCEVNDYVNKWGNPVGGCSGGNFRMLASLFSQKGIVTESCDPYVAGDSEPCDCSCTYEKTLLDWRIISGGSVPDTTLLKNYIYQQASPVYVSIFAGSDYDPGWRAEFGTYNGGYTLYYPSCPYGTNHAVLIVGWDDTLVHDGGTGGWIVKNSWGTNWGGACGYGSERGYFTIAYGSANIGRSASYMAEWQDYDEHGGILYYDDDCADDGAWSGSSASTTTWGLCEFTPTCSTYATRVEFWTTDVTTDIDVYLYDDFDGDDLGNSTLLWSSLDHSFAEAGYHGVDVDLPVPISSAADITAVVAFTNETYAYPVACDRQGLVETGRCYVSGDGSADSWYDTGSDEDHASDLGIRVRTSDVCDWGDAPDSTYPTLLTSDGARHIVVEGYHLGASVDREGDGQPNADATGDDADGDGDDEDGVIFTSAYVPGQDMAVTVVASQAGYLDAWFDFNNDGDWADAEEQVFASELLAEGANSLSFGVPEEASTDDSICSRFRFSSMGELSYTGEAEDGEVEDYAGFRNGIVLSLKAGWNMVSVPVTPDDPSVESVFPGAEAVYTWDPDTDSYLSVSATGDLSTIEPERSYWVAVFVADTILIEGEPVTEVDLPLGAGWNMVGSIYGETIALADLFDEPPDSIDTACVYTWDPLEPCFVLCSEIEPGKGYWMAASEPCTLTMPPPP